MIIPFLIGAVSFLIHLSGSYGIKYYSQYDECHTTEQDYCIAFRFTEIIDEKHPK